VVTRQPQVERRTGKVRVGRICVQRGSALHERKFNGRASFSCGEESEETHGTHCPGVSASLRPCVAGRSITRVPVSQWPTTTRCRQTNRRTNRRTASSRKSAALNVNVVYYRRLTVRCSSSMSTTTVHRSALSRRRRLSRHSIGVRTHL